MGKLIDGKALSEAILTDVSRETSRLSTDKGLSVHKPGLALILVGDDPASQIYVRNKERRSGELGFNSWVYRLDKSSNNEDVLKLIKQFNADPNVHGILVQLPLPKHLNSALLLNSILAEKDVDGLTYVNAGRLVLGESPFHVPCTPSGIIELIKSTGQSISGKVAVVVGRSNIVGKPVASLLLNESATVITAHSKTANLPEITKLADILVVAVGRDRIINGDMVKAGAIVIDVGINRTENGLFGDVDTNDVIRKASFITPVPGGVGPMTIAMLLRNTLNSYRRANSIN